VFTGECFFGISYAFKVSNNQSNESINSICIGEVFQVEVSDDLPSLLKSSKVNLYPAKLLLGARLLRSSYAFRVHNDHYNESKK